MMRNTVTVIRYSQPISAISCVIILGMETESRGPGLARLASVEHVTISGAPLVPPLETRNLFLFTLFPHYLDRLVCNDVPTHFIFHTCIHFDTLRLLP